MDVLSQAAAVSFYALLSMAPLLVLLLWLTASLYPPAQQALVEQVQGAALPADRGHLLRRQKSLAHRLSPSFGYQKPAIIATLAAKRSGILRRNFAKFQRTVQ